MAAQWSILSSIPASRTTPSFRPTVSGMRAQATSRWMARPMSAIRMPPWLARISTAAALSCRQGQVPCNRKLSRRSPAPARCSNRPASCKPAPASCRKRPSSCSAGLRATAAAPGLLGAMSRPAHGITAVPHVHNASTCRRPLIQTHRAASLLRGRKPAAAPPGLQGRPVSTPPGQAGQQPVPALRYRNQARPTIRWVPLASARR